MVGHTGMIPGGRAARSRRSTAASVAIVDRVLALGGTCSITADHGNAEDMLEPDGVSPHTAHTTNPVPLHRHLHGPRVCEGGGELSDVAPTVLALLGARRRQCR